MIRPATLGDLGAILNIAIEQTSRYPLLRADRKRIKALAVDAISAARHFCYVSEEGGEVTGVIAGMCSDNVWAERQNCHVVLWVSKVAGDGRKMLKALMDWIHSRRAVRVVGFAPDTDDIDTRVWRLIERMGFTRYGGAYLHYN